jgi:hypothetical protein
MLFSGHPDVRTITGAFVTVRASQPSDDRQIARLQINGCYGYRKALRV